MKVVLIIKEAEKEFLSSEAYVLSDYKVIDQPEYNTEIEAKAAILRFMEDVKYYTGSYDRLKGHVIESHDGKVYWIMQITKV